MNVSLLLKFLLLGIVLSFELAVCAEVNRDAVIRLTDYSSKNNSQILFTKRPNHN
jgi:hypothetical protein